MGPWAHERFPSIREESNNPSRRGSASGRDSLPPLASMPQRDGTIMENVLRQAGTTKRQPDGGLDPRFRQLLADRSEAEICLRVVDQDRLLPPERPASELDQALGDPRVGAGQATARGLEQAIFVRLEQVDGEPLGAEQLGDPLDCGLEGVGQRKLRDRLSDDGDERPAAFQLDRLPPRPLARAQSVSSPRRKRRQGVEDVVGGDERLLEAELQRPKRRLAKLDDPRARHDREGAAGGERFDDVALGPGVGAGTVRTGDTRPQLFVESPDDRAFGPGSLHGESRDLLGRSSLVETGGERIAAEPQQLLRREGLTVLAVSGQPHERKGSVLGRQSPERALSGGERSGAPEELQPAELPLAERDRQL